MQGNEYRFARDRDFALVTVSAQWNLFNGGRDAARAEQATLDTRRLETQRAELERRIALEVRQAYEGARVAREAIGSRVGLGGPHAIGTFLADLVLRGLLVDPSGIDGIQAQADALDASAVLDF